MDDPTDTPAAAAPPVKLFLGLPVYGGYDPHFVTGLLSLVRRPPCEMRVAPCIGDSLVARARNRLAAEFLRSDCTHLLFLDTDLIFSVEHVARLVGHGEPLVAGIYPKKQRELAWVLNALDEGSPGPDERGLEPVKYAGTGCLLIAREVLVAMIARWPDLVYRPDELPDEVPDDAPEARAWDFFSCGVWECPRTGRRRYLSEDWYFCQRARDLGYEILADTQVILKHVGQFIFPFDKIESFADPVEAGPE